MVIDSPTELYRTCLYEVSIRKGSFEREGFVHGSQAHPKGCLVAMVFSWAGLIV